MNSAEPGFARRRSIASAIVSTARPRQWIKNLLVFAAPAAAGVLGKEGYAFKAAVAALMFTVASAGVYFINDAVDLDADRNHESKYRRPVASGELGHRWAYAIGAILVTFAVVSSRFASVPNFSGILAGYALISISYTIWLKHIAVVDMLAVASGFILRAIAGGVATGVPISQWFLIVVSFGSLFVVSGKRFAEHAATSDGNRSRSVLESYSLRYLQFVRGMAAAAAVTGYCLWAFDRAQHLHRGIWIEISIAPFVAMLMRYALLLDQGNGEFPEEIVLRDPTLQVIGIVLVATLSVGIYGG